MTRLVIFDWDGTLADSHARIVHAMRAAFLEQHLAVPSTEQVRDIIGLSLEQAIAQLGTPLHPAQVATLVDRYRHLYAHAVNMPSGLFAGARETLDALTAQGCIVAIATGKSRAGLKLALAECALDDYFSTTICADESEPKPHPAMVRELLQLFDLEPTDAVMIGDTTYDLEMAAAAGIAAFAVSWGAHPRQRLLDLRPALLIERWADLLAALPAPVVRR